MTSTITITFGDQGENHVGMEKIGQLADNGFDYDDLYKAKNIFDQENIATELYHLGEEAYILIARQAANHLVQPYTSNDLFLEQSSLDWDMKAKMYGRVVNKKARYNLCYANYDQEPNYEIGQGRVINFNSVPLLNQIKNKLPLYLGEKANNLIAEGNYYYDINKCGIGYHGDAERRKVIALRLGASMPLYYQWYYQSKPVGVRMDFMINDGDLYVMSEKAVGHDWKKRNTYTLRHAAGAESFVKK